MERVLPTGMSATGKSAVVRELAARGYKAIDTDDGWCQVLADGRQLWREDAIAALLATEDTDILFVAGCEENQVRFYPQFDHIILLSAPTEILMQRLAARTSNSFGRSSAAGCSPTPRRSNRDCGGQPTTRSSPPPPCTS